jgi:hypothetical protein
MLNGHHHGILKHSIQESEDENVHFYNSLVLTDDLPVQRTHFNKRPPNIQCDYQRDRTSYDHEYVPLQNRSNDQKINIRARWASGGVKEPMWEGEAMSGASSNPRVYVILVSLCCSIYLFG